MLDPYTSMHFTSENAQLYDICLSVCLSQTQDHLDVGVADGATTTLTFRLVDARLAEVLVAMWHKCDTCIALCVSPVIPRSRDDPQNGISIPIGNSPVGIPWE